MIDIWTTVFLCLIIIFSLIIVIIVSLIMGGVITNASVTTATGIATTVTLDPTAWYWIMIIVFGILIVISAVIGLFFGTYTLDDNNKIKERGEESEKKANSSGINPITTNKASNNTFQQQTR